MRQKLWPLLLAIIIATSTKAQDANHNLEVGKNLDIFTSLYSNLDLLYVDTLNPAVTMTAAIDGMLRSLDPYTEYYPASDTKNLKMMLTGKYAGIGALVKYHSRLKRVVIDEPYAGMPAQEVGLKKGDIIVSIDDSLMTDKNVSYVSSHLRGDAGTTFVLKVLRPQAGGKEKEMKFKITRRNIKLPEMPYYGLSADSIGYINFNQFTEGSAKEVRRAFIDLKKQGAKGMVLDLRSNGGGAEIEAVDLVNIWVPQEQMVVENRGKIRQASRTYTTHLEPVDTVMPLVVLVNGETASASEITSGALQDLDRAVVMGTRTYGKGLVQVPMDLPYNTNVKITTSKYYIPSGRCIQAINYAKRRESTTDRRTVRNSSLYADRTPDSLTHVFYTRHGREVRDGGGIKPDIEAKNDTMPNIAYYLSAGGVDSTEVLFDYVVSYIDRHPQIAPAKEFHLTDEDWQEFRQKVIDSGFTYDDQSRKQFDELVKTAKYEGYYDDAREAFDALGQRLRHDLASELDKHRSTIQEVLELDIIAAYYFQTGSIEAGLAYDKVYQEAVALLKDTERYNGILKREQ
ncbi:MAG: S41 family peptidase [Prevotella sp.]|nr:S41 family peptidase [Prevotella sp.]MBR3480431.1 S41 family peptidase [Prevotella sp.]MBR6188824.1 S41 family peptidase [Prevotella sp.]